MFEREVESRRNANVEDEKKKKRGLEKGEQYRYCRIEIEIERFREFNTIVKVVHDLQPIHMKEREK